jgi:hypothetical protein
MKQYIKTKTGIVEFTPAFAGTVQVTSLEGEVTNKLAYDEQEQLKEKAKTKSETEAIALRRATRSVSIRAGREALISAGVLDKIEAGINAMTDAKEKALAKNWLEYSQVYMRNNPFLIKMTTALKMTPEQVDALFDEAEKLEVK